jgi:hypothetical protein
VAITADEAMREKDRNGSSKLEAAKLFLAKEVANGPQDSDFIKKRETVAKISPTTLKGAKKELRIAAKQREGAAHAGRTWRLSDDFYRDDEED